MAHGLWVGEGASWLLGAVVVGTDRLLRAPQDGPCWLDILKRLARPRE